MVDLERFIDHPLGSIKHPLGFFKHSLAKWSLKKNLKYQVTEDFLAILLEMMKGYYLIHPEHTKHFTGSYLFKDRDRGVDVLVKFDDGEMKVIEDPDPNPKPYPETTVTVTFKDSKALMHFLLEVKKDILQVLLHNEIQINGNLNYLYRFAFLANHPIRGWLNLEDEWKTLNP
jgi:hypothetical protein